MEDQTVLSHINELVAEEHRLREEGASTEHRRRLRELEEQLDQCWDLLRQRQARREAGENPEEAEVRPVDEVEKYLQ
ncbi:MAG: DUF2630 family protein [Marmoricola sp.]